MIHKCLCNKYNTTIWEEIYKPEEAEMKNTVMRLIRNREIERKREGLCGKGDELLTKENLERWLKEGETYASISYKYTGVSQVKVRNMVKKFGLDEYRTDKYKEIDIPIDDDVMDYVNKTSTSDIFKMLYELLTRECVKVEKSAPVPIPVLSTGFTADVLSKLLEEEGTYLKVSKKIGVDVKTVTEICKLYGLKSAGSKYKKYY